MSLNPCRAAQWRSQPRERDAPFPLVSVVYSVWHWVSLPTRALREAYAEALVQELRRDQTDARVLLSVNSSADRIRLGLEPEQPLVLLLVDDRFSVTHGQEAEFFFFYARSSFGPEAAYKVGDASDARWASTCLAPLRAACCLPNTSAAVSVPSSNVPWNTQRVMSFFDMNDHSTNNKVVVQHYLQQRFKHWPRFEFSSVFHKLFLELYRTVDFFGGGGGSEEEDARRAFADACAREWPDASLMPEPVTLMKRWVEHPAHMQAYASAVVVSIDFVHGSGLLWALHLLHCVHELDTCMSKEFEMWTEIFGNENEARWMRDKYTTRAHAGFRYAEHIAVVRKEISEQETLAGKHAQSKGRKRRSKSKLHVFYDGAKQGWVPNENVFHLLNL
jgi:hypothetical protein